MTITITEINGNNMPVEIKNVREFREMNSEYYWKNFNVYGSDFEAVLHSGTSIGVAYIGKAKITISED